MFEEVRKCLPVDIAVCAAAVTDFKPVYISNSKLKKYNLRLKSFELQKNIDILEFLG